MLARQGTPADRTAMTGAAPGRRALAAPLAPPAAPRRPLDATALRQCGLRCNSYKLFLYRVNRALPALRHAPRNPMHLRARVLYFAVPRQRRRSSPRPKLLRQVLARPLGSLTLPRVEKTLVLTTLPAAHPARSVRVRPGQLTPLTARSPLLRSLGSLARLDDPVAVLFSNCCFDIHGTTDLPTMALPAHSPF